MQLTVELIGSDRNLQFNWIDYGAVKQFPNQKLIRCKTLLNQFVVQIFNLRANIDKCDSSVGVGGIYGCLDVMNEANVFCHAEQTVQNRNEWECKNSWIFIDQTQAMR